ncbi:DUF805 domain-containing protein [Devosia sp. ZB163]|uniref:DUF805 domain-containing protein n=1 Tax=Devosia sp. ZB163 TaxID=3025938 RepID=UPI00236253E4|nr:DUF805 domain-containing protein [Devosia sp. ZB163]MDC9823252.1 DUF805 domain-containing protein [Devosia sp. ZB163]
MDFQYLYLRTDGRISRKTWWIGAIVLLVANLIISFLILPLVGLGGPNMAAIMANNTDPVQVAAIAGGIIQASAWGSLVVFLIFAYPAYCLSVKRRHDKNNNGRDILIYFAAIVVTLLVQALGFGFTVTDVQGVQVPTPNVLFSVIGFAVGVLGLYMLVVLGFLKGTNGTNDYGPDPLTGGAAATA